MVKGDSPTLLFFLGGGDEFEAMVGLNPHSFPGFVNDLNWWITSSLHGQVQTNHH